METKVDLTELNKLEELLRANDCGYVIKRDDRDIRCDCAVFGMHQLTVEKPDGTYMWDAICHFGSYGHEEGLLEVMGAPVVSPDAGDSVEGWLAADEVFSRWRAWLKEHDEAQDGREV